MSRPGIWYVALGCLASVVVGSGVGAADGRTGGGVKRKPPPYLAKGRSDIYATQGQVCFIGTWKGNGTWSTDWRDINPSGNVTYSDSSSYSWDATNGPHPGVCGFDLIRGFKPQPSGGWDRGSLRLEIRGDDNDSVGHQVCDNAKTTAGNVSGGTGSFTSRVVHGDALVFEVTVMVGERPQVPSPCALYADPLSEVGSFGGPSFLTSSSAAIPISVFEHAHTVSITISSDKSRIPHPNCGLTPDPYSDGAGGTISCDETGAWQGTLTFTVYHG